MNRSSKITISLYGGGPSNLLTAYKLSKDQDFDITIYEQGKQIGRKFLVAGNGGFNLSHNGTKESLKSKYKPKGFLDNCLERFDNNSTIEWLHELGIDSYYGTSGRLFPKVGIKPIEVLKNLKGLLKKNGVKIRTKCKCVKICKNNTSIESENGLEIIESDFHIYGFGGKSWKKTGSNGKWEAMFKKAGIEINEFIADNVGLNINWNKGFIDIYERTPLKNIAVIREKGILRGEALITAYGIEGNAIYPVSGEIINELNKVGLAKLVIDFKPIWSLEKVIQKFKSEKGNTSQKLRAIGMPGVVIAMLKSRFSKEDWLKKEAICQCLKSFPLDVVGHQNIDDAISTQGGIQLNQLDKSFQLISFPKHYCNGEMISWSAPTGGYLLQACFSIGNLIAEDIIAKKLDINSQS